MTTELLSTHTAALFDSAVKRAADLLRAGDVVALPTETVYGLAANALNSEAVARIYEIKGRPSYNPIIVHVADVSMARRCVAEWPAEAEKLATAFWPGPLTVVLPRAKEIPDNVTASGPTVGVRWPSHPFIQAVIRECGFPLAAPSANLSNELSPTNAAHVKKHLGGKLPLIVDGGQSQVGIESTVVDLTVTPPRVLRPGIIHDESLIAAGLPLSRVILPVVEYDPKSPGMLKKHYCPRARLKLLNWRDDLDLRFQVSQFTPQLTKCHVIAYAKIPVSEIFGSVSVIPHDAEAFARALYAELHRCDEAGAEWIIVEAPPDTHEWWAIADRLRRAAHVDTNFL